jgi:hypothetical protein
MRLRFPATSFHWRGEAIMVSKPRKKVVGKSNPERDQWPMAEAIALRTKQTGNHAMAVGDIQEALVGGKLHAQRRNEATGKFEDLPSEFWIEYEFFYKVLVERTLLTIRPRHRTIWDTPEQTEIPGHFFYVSRSDYEKLWSLAERELPQDGKPAAEETEVPQNRKPGRKTRKDWPLHVAGELYRIVVIENKRAPAASYFAQFCEDKLDYQPDIRAVQRLVKQLLGD